MSEEQENSLPPETSSIEESDGGRRAFLTRSGALVAMLAAAGVAGVEGATAQTLTDGQSKAVRNVMQAAIANGGNVDTALRTTKAQLPASTVETLKGLTAADWKAAAQLNTKLSRLKNMAADINGYIGM